MSKFAFPLITITSFKMQKTHTKVHNLKLPFNAISIYWINRKAARFGLCTSSLKFDKFEILSVFRVCATRAHVSFEIYMINDCCIHNDGHRIN